MTNIKSECILITAPEKGLEQYSLITCKIECPAYIWTELLTHKRFARNASSNRAMKVAKNLSSLGFYLPDTFFLDGSGMSSGEATSEEIQLKANKIWNKVWKYCSKASQELSDLGVSREQSSRVLPTFKMMRGLVTGTQDAWSKFFLLRISPLADRAMQELATKIKQSIETTPIQYGTFHLPFITNEELTDKVFTADEILYVNAGRIARISYGDVSTKQDDYVLGKRLKDNNHMSPFEHTAGWVKNPRSNTLCSKEKDRSSENFGWENARAAFEKVENEKSP